MSTDATETEPGVPNLVPLVENLRWNVKGAQRWYDGWRGHERICRFHGRCIVCYRRCYGFDDGENDPRGVLGDHAVSWMSPSDYGWAPPDGHRPEAHDRHADDVVICFLCENEEPSYRAGLRASERLWRQRGWRPE